MEKIFEEAWNRNQEKVKDYFRSVKEVGSYKVILEETLKIIFGDTQLSRYEVPDYEKITVVDDGCYQGTQIYVFPNNAYEIEVSDYWYTHNYYGSCSGCDTLLSIVDFTEAPYTEKQVNDLWTLALHLIQKIKPLVSKNAE